MLQKQMTLNCNGRLLLLDRPQVMGILNLTPDSFYEGSRVGGVDEALRLAEQMINEGADILDLGGMSSRPGAEIIPIEEELQRVLPAIEAINQRFPEALISVDTLRAKVAKEAVAAGASMVNDISAGHIDPDMFSTIASLNVPYVLMHMRGKPADMQGQTKYEDVVTEIFDYLAQQLAHLRSLGIKDVIIDPGFGFGKTIAQNFELLDKLHIFRIMEVPILVGISRKSMIWKTIHKSPKEALAGTCALHMVCLQQGAQFLRVHDVAAAKDIVNIWMQMQS